MDADTYLMLAGNAVRTSEVLLASLPDVESVRSWGEQDEVSVVVSLFDDRVFTFGEYENWEVARSSIRLVLWPSNVYWKEANQAAAIWPLLRDVVTVVLTSEPERDARGELELPVQALADVRKQAQQVFGALTARLDSFEIKAEEDRLAIPSDIDWERVNGLDEQLGRQPLLLEVGEVEEMDRVDADDQLEGLDRSMFSIDEDDHAAH